MLCKVNRLTATSAICDLTKYLTTTSAICDLTKYLTTTSAICDLTKYLTTTSAICSTKYQFPILCKHTVKYEDLTLLDDQVGDKALSP